MRKYAKAYHDVLYDTDLSAVERVVLTHLGEIQGANDVSWHKQGAMGEKLGFSRKSINEAIGKLEKRKLITIERHRGCLFYSVDALHVTKSDTVTNPHTVTKSYTTTGLHCNESLLHTVTKSYTSKDNIDTNQSKKETNLLTPYPLAGVSPPEEKSVVVENPPTAPTVSVQKPPRGTRLPADWALQEEDGEWAETQGLQPDCILAEADKFKDYWHSKAGKDATKIDWRGTWRNWIRRAAENQKNQQLRSKKYG